MTVLVSIPVTIALFTLLLAALTQFHWQQSNKKYKTALYVGRVSHTRLIPVIHSFNYPLFMCAVDLEETDRLWGIRDPTSLHSSSLWPLSIVMRFREQDHYKNGEGGGIDLSLTERTMNLVKERISGTFAPSQETHRIVLVTHLSYYGYCFNPVSFYYILRRDSHKMDALVLEVSNTPWNEMQCYVLHPSSIDVEHVQPGRPKTRHDRSEIASTNYLFQKMFHVSPFMDMEYLYDWIFWEFSAKNDPITLYASMRKGDVRQFTANVEIFPIPFTPFKLAWQLIRFPIYCAIIQIWIHIEAFWLFQKGVTFQPHPKGSETTASRLIGSIMRPLFALKDWVHGFCREKQE